MPSTPKIKVFVTFVTTKKGSQPALMIEDPEDLTESIGKFKVNEFSRMKQALADVVDDEIFNMFFHNDPKNLYSFDESSLRRGAIYGRKEKRDEDETEGEKITAARLKPIQSQSQFEKHVKEISEEIYRRPSSTRRKKNKTNDKRNENRPIDYYKLDLCVVMIKERVPSPPKKHRSSSAPPVRTITTNLSNSLASSNVDETTETTPTISTESTRKRKKREVYRFKARSLSVCLHAPIEVMEKKNQTITGVPSGKTNKSISYDLERFILGNQDDSSNSETGGSSSNEEEDDETFSLLFTFSKFRADMMKLSVEKFPEEYAPKTEAIGPRCKLYIQKQWNNRSWSEISTTDEFITMLKDQMDTKGRVSRNNVLTLRMSFGRAKLGKSFSTFDEFDDYVNPFHGEGLTFSQNEEPASSPLTRRVGKIMRKDIHCNSTKITELITRLYQSDSSKLHYGFLHEHVESFQRIIAGNIAVRRDDSVFMMAIEESSIPTHEEINQELLSVFFQRHQNSTVGGMVPEINKFPPTNEETLIVPPFLRDWKKSNNIYQMNNQVASHFGINQNRLPPSLIHHASARAVEEANPSIIGLTFKSFYDDDEITAIINGKLTINSTIQEVIDEYEIKSDLLISDLEQSKFLIKKKTGSYFTLKFNRFISMTVGDVISFKNIDDEYIIEIKEPQIMDN